MFRRKRTDASFREEIESHIALETDRLIEEGMDPRNARALATRRFGNVAVTEERFYESRRILWLDHLVQDLRYALRGLRSHPTFTAVVILTLALGIGANTAIFSVLEAVLLKPLPYRNPSELVYIVETVPASHTVDAKPRRIKTMDLGELDELRRHGQMFAGLEAYDTNREVTLIDAGQPVRVIATPVSVSLLPMLGIQPVLGRTFRAGEEKPGSAAVILSHAAWQKYFGSAPGILNHTVTIDGRSHLVAGVMPSTFAFPDRETEFWLPLDLTPPRRGITSATPLARLRPGVTAAAAASEANAVVENLRRSYPPDREVTHATLQFATMKDELVQPVQTAFIVLTIAVGFVLLIACSNVSNLLIARGAARQGEHAVRAALGASRGRLIQQTLTESCLLAILGGAIGCFVAFGGLPLLKDLGANAIPRLDEVGIDLTVLGFTLTLSALTGILFGLFPALRWSRASEIHVIKAAMGGKSAPQRPFHGFVVVIEVAMAVVLLIGGGLLLRSFFKLSHVDPGFDARNVLMFQIALPQPVVPAALTESQTQEVLSRIQSLPGVETAGYANAAPLVERSGFGSPRIQGTPLPIQGQPEFRQVSQEYFSTMGIRLIAGRGFSVNDGPGDPRVVVVNRAMLSYFGGGSAIGKTLTLAGNPAEIVGIVDDTHEKALNLEPRPEVYLNSRQSVASYKHAEALQWAYFVVRTGGDPAALIPSVQTIVRETIPGATLKLNTSTLEEIVYRSIGLPRFYTVLLSLFGALAVFLAMIGVYGITTYAVAHRTREIGIRIALGAGRLAVLGLEIRRTAVLSMAGIAVGLTGAAMLTRYLEGMLFGLTPMDPMTFAAIPAAFAVTALLAAYVPARRAMKVDPVVALRQE